MNLSVLVKTGRFRMAAILAIALAIPRAIAAQAPESKYEQPTNLTGSIYADPQRTKLLFKFQRVASRTGSTLSVVRDYTNPDGQLAARERVLYEGDDLVSFELEELQVGAKGSATIRRDPRNPAKGSIEFKYAPASAPPAKTDVHQERLPEVALINDMVAPFLLSRWTALMAGQKVKCRCLVVSRGETVGFTFTKDSETTWQGRAVVRLKMEPTSLVFRPLVAPLLFTLEKAPPHRVLQYVGRTTPKIRSRGQWRDLDAVTIFDWN